MGDLIPSSGCQTTLMIFLVETDTLRWFRGEGAGMSKMLEASYFIAPFKCLSLSLRKDSKCATNGEIKRGNQPAGNPSTGDRAHCADIARYSDKEKLSTSYTPQGVHIFIMASLI